MSKRHTPHWDASAGAAVNARRELPRLVAGYFSHVREMLAENPPPAKLHAIRIETKGLRYTLELFRPCYGPGLDTRLAALRQVQQLLGEVNDACATERKITESMKASPQRARITQFLAEQASKFARNFHIAWTNVFDAPGQELWWTRYLARQARAPGRGGRLSAARGR